MHEPWLSVVVPTCNGERYLPRMLDSICIQGNDLIDDVEIIAIDDGSTDDTVGILKSYANRLPLEVIEVQGVHNWVKNTNLGLHRANGSYISILHQDDLWLPNRLSTLKQLLRESPSAGLIFHPVRYVDAWDTPVGLLRCPFSRSIKFIESTLFIERMLTQNFVGIAAPIFKREAALQVGGLNERLWYSADWDFWLKLAGTLSEIRYHSKPLAAFRLHIDSLTNRRSAMIEEFRTQIQTALDPHLANWEQQPLFDHQLVRKTAQFSIEANVFLAAKAHGHKQAWSVLFREFTSLGLRGGYRYLRDSRIIERVVARLRALGMTLSKHV